MIFANRNHETNISDHPNLGLLGKIWFYNKNSSTNCMIFLCAPCMDCEFVCGTISLKLLHYFVVKNCIVKLLRNWDRGHSDQRCNLIEVERTTLEVISSNFFRGNITTFRVNKVNIKGPSWTDTLLTVFIRRSFSELFVDKSTKIVVFYLLKWHPPILK